MKRRERTFKCDFYGCPNTTINTQKKIGFHKFPVSATRCEKWSESCHMVNLVTSDSLVCSDHFEPWSFPRGIKTSRNQKLVWNAKPTIPARTDNNARFPDKDASCSVVYPMINDWGPFLCRLCTQPVSALQTTDSNTSSDNCGIHIFGEEAQNLKLREKINMYLPQPVQLEDSLPKFVCRLCIQRVLDTADTVNAFRNADTKLRDELRSKGNLQDLEAPNLKGKFTPSELPYKCSTCDHLFSDINSLLSHELDHTKPITTNITPEENIQEQQLPFKCPECALTFLSRHSMFLHCSQHHGTLSSSDSLVSILLDRIDIDEQPFQFSTPQLSQIPNMYNINTERESDTNVREIIVIQVPDKNKSKQNIETKISKNKKSQNSIVEIKVPNNELQNGHNFGNQNNVPKLRPSISKINESKIKNIPNTSKILKNSNKNVSKSSENKSKSSYNTRSISKNNTKNVGSKDSVINTQSSVLNYIEVPSIEISYECSECPATFSDLSLFKKHLNLHKKNKQRPTCNHCNKSFSISGFKTHIKRLRKENKEYICDLCKKQFKDRHYLVMHIKNTHNESRLQCSKCPRTFKSREGLQGHLMRHEGIYSFLCDICGSKFLTQSAMRIHRRRHTQQNFFTCGYCGKKIQEHNRFQDHIRTHTGETPFGCEKCPRKFHSKKLLKQHMQIHTNIRPHKCPHCNLSFKRVGNLKQHIERHKNYRPICSICRATFNTCEERNEHRRTHTLEEREEAKIARMKPRGPKRNRNQFLCKFCKTVFNSKEEKAEHLLQNPDHVNSIKCQNCDQTFRSLQSLSVHQRVHTGERPYSCSICLKSFRTYATCRQHTQVHTNDNKFKCDLCERSFNRLYTLNVHKRSHSNDRPFSCPTCGRGFKQKQDMKKHMKLHLVKDNNDIIPNSRIHENKWILPDDLGVNLNQPLQETITIPTDMHSDLNYSQNNLLSSSNIVITVPFVHTGDPQAYFSM